MYWINKVVAHPTVDFAAEELKKYVSDKPLVYRWREGRFVKE